MNSKSGKNGVFWTDKPRTIGRLGILATAAATAWLADPRAIHADVVSPSAQTAVEGTGDNGYPFNVAAFAIPSMRYQQVYAASEFGSSPLTITAISFRPDAFVGGAFATVLPSVQINLSTTPAGPDALSPVFAANVGGDDTVVVPAGPLPLSSSNTGPALGPKVFDIVIPLTTSFVYDPTQGNLLMDVRNFGGGATVQFDAELALGDPASRQYSEFAGSVSSPIADGTVGTTWALVTKFSTTGVLPEPTSGAIIAIASAAVVSRRRRKV